ncbi:hypothetical protein FisN_4Hh386 [Fistulifera solaris]|uniref:Uncharacterized protein n=1 Tax=Fistulifera solaris TaxID=1519565 RepID=A0A1Z5KQ41_FISSO|nr:hypothetical protein FisN_4Hh386 [Fistulifera solaris]|eukprot:GAX28423.1 hypothetical protein FisN_4Hh386 [Fistulifera solaris]
MFKIGNLAAVVTLFVGQAVAVDAGYNIIPRDTHRRHLQPPAASPQPISFDGDLERIISLAMERAEGFNPDEASSPTVTPAPTITPSPTVTPVHAPNVCEGADLSRLELFKWKYTIETVAQADVNAVIGQVEEMLQERLVPLLLSCNAKDVANASIVAIDCTLPLDTISLEAVCAPELNADHNCTAVDGTMRVFLSDPEAASEALSLTDQTVKKVIEDPAFVDQVGKGLMKITLIDNNVPVDSISPDPERAVGEQGFSPFSFVIVAVGSAALIAFVGSVYYWRRGGEADGDAAGAAGSSLYTDTFTSGGNTESPFAEMVPSAYAFNGNMSVLTPPNGMSPVLEDDNSSHSPLEMDSFDMPAAYYDSNSESQDTLGARKRAGGALTAGHHLSDSLDAGEGTPAEIDDTHGPADNEDLLGLQDIDISTDNESKVSETISQQLFSDFV